ncbi:HTH domain-containing protein [Microbispora rosea]|uniref:helix-turn-helix transcriptional regulator n=1 Tax=Microbispora rosea TaxID=58117 RepID=UPI003F4DC8F6
MRADRLVSLVLLLRQHGRLSATALARELEVSTRTVLRDIEALSAAGVPVYAERGRHGGFALLPGFRTELTGLNHDEALALLVAGSRRGAQAFGLGSALASAMLKVVDALPESYRDTAAGAAERLLIDPETDLLSRRLVAEEVPDAVVAEVLRAVFAGHKLRIHYAAADQPPKCRRPPDRPPGAGACGRAPATRRRLAGRDPGRTSGLPAGGRDRRVAGPARRPRAGCGRPERRRRNQARTAAARCGDRRRGSPAGRRLVETRRRKVGRAGSDQRRPGAARARRRGDRRSGGGARGERLRHRRLPRAQPREVVAYGAGDRRDPLSRRDRRGGSQKAASLRMTPRSGRRSRRRGCAGSRATTAGPGLPRPR